MFSPWVALHYDADHVIRLDNRKTGAIRCATWVSLRTRDGCVFFANLLTHGADALAAAQDLAGHEARSLANHSHTRALRCCPSGGSTLVFALKAVLPTYLYEPKHGRPPAFLSMFFFFEPDTNDTPL